jgi:hypothetical protein
MSFCIKAGYDATLKQIKNVILLKTNSWQRGNIRLNDRANVCQINSASENKLEIIRYNDKHALLLNSMIIYENEKLFTYDINLSYLNNIDHSCIHYTFINYNDLTIINPFRQLN